MTEHIRTDKVRAAQPQQRQPSARKQRAAELLVTGQETSAGAALRRAGYALSTSRVPASNNLGHLDLVRTYHETRGEELDAKTAHTTGMRTLLELAGDKDEPGSTRGAAAKTLVEIAKDEGLEAEGITRLDWLEAYLEAAHRISRAIALTLRRPDLAVRYQRRLENKIAVWGREYATLAPSGQARRSWAGLGSSEGGTHGKED